MFIAFTLGFVGIIFLLFQLASWPSAVYLVLAFLVLLSGFRLHKPHLSHFSSGVIIGWIALSVFVFFNPKIPEPVTYQTLWAEGRVVSLVEQRPWQKGQVAMTRMEFKLSHLQSHPDLSQADYKQAWWLSQPKIRLSCYRCDWQPKVDETWRLPIRIKLIHGSMNPGGFDYEAWAYQQGLVASGYVRTSEGEPEFIERGWSYQRMREAFAKAVEPMMKESEFSGIYQALLYADRRAISAEDWEVMRATGTIHLMAISGLHMALVALMGYGLGALVWRLPIKRFETYPVQWLGAGFAVVLVTLYGLLAGFTIPTQRAWIMVMVGVLFIVIRRKFQPWSVLMLAAFLVVLWHPPSVLAQGFWLSFLAVALIFAWLKTPWSQNRSGWQQALAIQFILSIGLIPALWWFHQQVPVYSVAANLIAVPFVSFIGLPLLFVSALITLFFPSSGVFVAWLNDQAWYWLWAFLTWLAQRPASEWSLAPIELGAVLLVYAGLFVAVFASTRWLKGVALVMMAVLLVWPRGPESIPEGHFRLTLLDVGQGQALVIETRHHLMVYDTGPRFGDRLDGSLIGITPYLKTRGASKIDLLMISHADNDHAGGTARLIQDWPINQTLSGEPERLEEVYQVTGFEFCQADQAWSWDGVDFKVLSPGIFSVSEANDYSCVLQVKSGDQSLMITGDLHGRFERRLIAHYGSNALASQVLVAGHHGSRHSTYDEFLSALAPELVLFTAGYRNRFNFPHTQVLERLERHQVDWLNTACEGAIQVTFTPTQWQVIQRARQHQKRWFHHQCPE
ncbi:DNA internalization-related competence protein ComEC/Rec2 [Thiomicrospira sp. R3]|uniref:DNA internalization-related competence protein ComEC/Rec2 n=1 Tax=Thiomicrospira sp. R3 TaxID=3035472 RepID=UPI00259B154F|nr:DNA internalization-related competence protein ComEC/Rec2 [Thiomicrospira sp. R3]WFE68547.1 DNA internalization-related competence protein ComEC/Rec2 [Thiomicrospira sp. R3]